MKVVPTRGIEPRSLALQASATTTLAQSAEWSYRPGSNRRLPVTGRARCQQRFGSMVGREGIEPSVCGLKARGFALVASGPNLAPQARVELASHRLTAERVAVATTGERNGCPRRYRASVSWFRARHPAIERGGKVVGNTGFQPALRGPKPRVLAG